MTARRVTPEQELLSRVVRNGAWLFGGSSLARLLTLIRGVVLAWLLAPQDFGLFALGTTLIGVVSLAGDIGAGVFLIYQRDRTETDVNTAFWVNLLFATLLAIGVAAASPLVGRLYRHHELQPIITALAVGLWLQLVASVPRNLLRREFRFRPIAVISVVSSAGLLASALVLGLAGAGVWALVVSTLIGYSLETLLLYSAARWVPQRQLSRDSLRRITKFSGWYLGAAFVWYLAGNLDNLLIGKFLGLKQLGFYSLAYNYALFPLVAISTPLGQVIVPELAQIRDDPDRFWDLFRKTSKLLVGLVAPLAAALIVAAPDLFSWLVAAKWAPAVLPFQILLGYVLARGLWADPLGALGRFDLAFWLGLATCVAEGLAIYLVRAIGIPAVAAVVLGTVGVAHVLAVAVASGSWAKLAASLRAAFPRVAVAGTAALAAVAIRGLASQSWGGKADPSWLWTSIDLLIVFGIYGSVFRDDVWNVFSHLSGRKVT